jgi:addiction module HigA family antidote
MPMKNPPHPGLSVRINCLEPLGLSVTDGAKALGVSRQALSRLINGKAGVSTDMAIRLAKAFGTTPDIWIRMQAAYDVAQARSRAAAIDVKRYRPRTAA